MWTGTSYQPLIVWPSPVAVTCTRTVHWPGTRMPPSATRTSEACGVPEKTAGRTPAGDGSAWFAGWGADLPAYDPD